MTSKPSASCSAVMHSGGLVWIALLADHRVQAVVAEELADGLHLVAGAVERGHRRPRLVRPDELEDPEQPEVAVRADRRVLGRERLVVAAHHAVEARGVADEVVLLVDADRRQRRGQADRVAAVREAAVEHPALHRLGDGVAHRDGAQRQVARRQALGHRHQVRHDVPVVDGEPAAGAAEARHDLVADHQDPVAVADLAHALDVAVGRDEDAVGADDGLEEDRGDRARALVPDHVLEALERLRDRTRLGLAPAVRVRVADRRRPGRARSPSGAGRRSASSPRRSRRGRRGSGRGPCTGRCSGGRA